MRVLPAAGESVAVQRQENNSTSEDQCLCQILEPAKQGGASAGGQQSKGGARQLVVNGGREGRISWWSIEEGRGASAGGQ